MQETRKIIGQIMEKKIDENDKFTKYTFVVRTQQGKTMSLGLFISNSDKEEIKLKKQGFVQDFKKNETAEFEFYDQVKGTNTYHNIVNIQEVDTKETDYSELKKADEKYNLINPGQGLEEKPKPVATSVWSSKCISFKGSMQEIALKIDEINKNENTFVVATHQPTKITTTGNHFYETLIFYKERSHQ